MKTGCITIYLFVNIQGYISYMHVMFKAVYVSKKT